MYYILFLLIILSNILYGNNDCKIDKNIGFSNFKIYTKNKDVYIIIDNIDYRYGTISTVYNAVNCKKVASGEKKESNFEEIFKEKGYRYLKVKQKGKYLNNSLSSVINFNQNSDYIYINTSFIDSFTIFKLNNLLSMVSKKNINFNYNLSNELRNIINYKYFNKLFLTKIKNTPKETINYKYSFWLSSLIDDNFDIEYKLIYNLFSMNVKSIKDVPNWLNMIQKYRKENIISKFNFSKEIIKLPDFGKKISQNNSFDFIDTFLNTLEYKYAFKYLKPKITKITNYNEEYGISIKYPYFSQKINFTDTHLSCKKFNTFEKEKEKEVKCNSNDLCKKIYQQYYCKADKNRLPKIKKLEKILTGSNKNTHSLDSGGWFYSEFLKYKIIEKNYYKKSFSEDKGCELEVYTTCAPGLYPCREVQNSRYVCH